MAWQSNAIFYYLSSFQSCECDVYHRFVFFQIDRVVEELENRPELQHVVSVPVFC